eukprot:s6157_g1.t1
MDEHILDHDVFYKHIVQHIDINFNNLQLHSTTSSSTRTSTTITETSTVTPGGDPDGLLLGTGATSPGGTAAAASLGGFLLLGAVLVPLYSYRKRWIEQQGEPEDDESQGGYEIAYLGQASWVEACSVLPSSPTSSKADLTAGHATWFQASVNLRDVFDLSSMGVNALHGRAL